jgi:hypothetical protein
MDNQFQHSGCGGIVVYKKPTYVYIRCGLFSSRKSAFKSTTMADDPFGDFYPDGLPEHAPDE